MRDAPAPAPAVRRLRLPGPLIAGAAIALLLTTLAGCGAGGADESARGMTVRDSAGIRIVDNDRPSWPADSGWRVATEPSLSIGTVEGDSMLILSRVFSATRLTNGHIVVADGGSTQLRYFDSTGQFVVAAGGRGEGPGEFTFLGRIWRLPGDTVVATDLTPRISHFGADGRYIRATEVAAPEGVARASVVGQAGDGHYLSMSGRGFGSEQAGRVITDSIRLIVTPPAGSGGREFARVRAQERWGLRTGDRVSFPFLPFSSPSSYATGGDQFVLGDGRTPSLAVWNTDGTPRHILRWRTAPRPVTDAHRARYGEYRLDGVRDPNERRRAETFLAEAPTADSLPVYRDVLVDAVGNVWAEEYRLPWEEQATWQLFAPDGGWLGAVRTPPRLTIMEIGDDYLLGRWVDDDNVEYVRMYALNKDR